MIETRLRTRIADPAMDSLVGKVLGHRDYDLLLTGAARVLMPDGRPLCVYLPGALAQFTRDEEYYRVLSSIRLTTRNRGIASGTRRLPAGPEGAQGSRTNSKEIISSVIGALDPTGQQRYCRLTAWTGKHLPQWQTLHPMLRAIAHSLERHVPDLYANQKTAADRTPPEWIIPGTPFTTVTVNSTYPTGVHTDKGDLEEGFSTIACLRRGTYTGGQLVFPQYRVAVDMRDGDLILMDAHQWHGNVAITCGCGHRLDKPCPGCDAERISLVSYYRTRMQHCGTADEEYAKAAAAAEKRSGL
ncbi:hypothetical protein RM572_00460 [Streptomyces sp. DSM 42041]|uniref:2OGFeDO JBP1/TET oxygenase domain-containing protein n=1 Tax=Streptomyces hazeniae TaxID=3075538 RepID=A0ABU2NK02_9ACTN|nr:hypothetical protein [Streptomyces sp. DSM 42041]MDT0377248.1 hypothetical protein [Streptomyces sp. DSM 42041]